MIDGRFARPEPEQLAAADHSVLCRRELCDRHIDVVHPLPIRGWYESSALYREDSCHPVRVEEKVCRGCVGLREFVGYASRKRRTHSSESSSAWRSIVGGGGSKPSGTETPTKASTRSTVSFTAPVSSS